MNRYIFFSPSFRRKGNGCSISLSVIPRSGSRYLVDATPIVVEGSTWNFPGIFEMVWQYACAFGIFLKLFFVTQVFFWVLCQFSSTNSIDSGYLVDATTPFSCGQFFLKLCRCFYHGQKICAFAIFLKLFFVTFSEFWTVIFWAQIV